MEEKVKDKIHKWLKKKEKQAKKTYIYIVEICSFTIPLVEGD